METLSVGMYVRHKTLLSSKYVKINKIKEIEEKENCLHIWLEDKDLITEKYLIKASYNIIDILEVGDYVNNERVEEIWKEIVLVGQECRPISFNNIKSIVTKQQFESIKYSLEG